MFSAGEDNSFYVSAPNSRGMLGGCSCLIKDSRISECKNEFGSNQGCDYFAVTDNDGQTYWGCSAVSNPGSSQSIFANLFFASEFQQILSSLQSFF